MQGGIEHGASRHVALIVGAAGLATIAAFLVLADEAQALDVNQDITQSTRWTLADSPVTVLRPVRVLNGATLTIDPGVEVRFRPDARLQIGESNSAGTMNAMGTASLPITFHSATGLKDWLGLYFYGPATTPQASLRNASVYDVNGNGIYLRQWRDALFTDTTVRDTTAAGVYVESSTLVWRAGRIDRAATNGMTLVSSTVTARDLVVDDSGKVGVLLDSGSRAGLTRVTIEDSRERPLRANVADDLSSVTFRGNDIQEIELWGNSLFANTRLVRRVDAASGEELPYTVLSTINVRGGSTMTVDPGVTLAFRGGQLQMAFRSCGWSCTSENGRVVAIGTQALPIRFTSDNGARSWSGLYFVSPLDGSMTNELANVTIERVSGNALTLDSGSIVRLRDSVVRDASGQGASVSSATLIVDRSTFAEADGYGLLADSGAAVAVRGSRFEDNEWPLRTRLGMPISGNAFDGNRFQEIQLWGTTISADFTLPLYADETSGERLRYRMLTGSVVRDRATLTLLPGTTVAFDPGQGLQIGTYNCGWSCSLTPQDAGSLSAIGTLADPITITSANGARSWGSIYVEGRGTPLPSQQIPIRFAHVVVEKSASTGVYVQQHPDTALDFVTVRDNAGIGIDIQNANSPVRDSLVQGNAAEGIRLINADSTLARNTLRANGWGVQGDSNSDPVLDSNVFDSNSRPIRTKWTSAWRAQTYTASTNKVIELWGHTFTTSVSLDPVLETGGAPHEFAFVSASLVRQSATLTLPPGTMIDLRGGELRAGTSGGTCANLCGSIVARGTEAAPIVIRGGRVLLDNYHNGAFTQVLENVTIRDAPDIALYTHYMTGHRFSNLRLENSNRGLYQYASTNLVYDDVDFVANRAEGAHVTSGGSATIRNSRFTDNLGTGAYAASVTLNLVDNVFTDTTGYAIYFASSVGTVTGNAIDGTGGRPLRVPIAALAGSNSVVNAGIRELDVAGGELLSSLTLDETPFTTPDVYTYRFVGSPLVRAGATLTLAAGQTLLFEPGVELRAGTGTSPGGIVAVGTPESPIRFTSLTNWYGLFVDGTAAPEVPSRFVHVDLDRVNSGVGALRIDNYDNVVVSDSRFHDNPVASGIRASGSSFTVTDSEFADNGYHGIALVGSANPTIRDNVLERNSNGLSTVSTDTPVVVDNVFRANRNAPAVVSVRTDLSRNTFVDTEMVEIWISGGDVRGATRLQRLTTNDTGEMLVYVVSENVRVLTPGTLDVDPGTTLAFRPSRNLQVGAYGTAAAGSLRAIAPANNPIVFTSHRGSSEWNGLYFDGRSGGGATPSTMRNVVIERSDSQAIRAYSFTGLTVEDAIIRDNAGTSVYLESASPTFLRTTILRSNGHGVDVRSGAPTFREVTIDTSAGFGLIADQAAIVSLHDSLIARSADRPLRVPVRSLIGADVRLDGNAYPEIELHGSTGAGTYPVSVDRTLPLLADASTGARAPYVALGRLDVVGATLTIAPGVTIRFQEVPLYDWRGAIVGYTDGIQVGNGATSGALVARATQADPVLLTSDTTGKTWAGVRFDGRGVARSSLLENVTIEKSRYEGLYAYRTTQLTVANSLLRANTRSGLTFDESPSTVRGTTAKLNGEHGILSNVAAARILGNTLESNALGGVLVTGSVASSPEVRGNVFRANAQAGFLAANAVTPVVADNRFEGAGRAIGVSNLAQPLDVRGGDAGAAGILDGLFRPRNGGTAWFYLTPVAYGPRHMTLTYDGPAGSSMDSTLRARVPLASFDVNVYATNDGRLVQSLRSAASAAGDLSFNILIDGARRAQVDIVPVVVPDFTWGPSRPTVETPVLFDEASSVLHADVVRVDWAFGDGNASVGAESTHQYSQKRSYLVTMTLTLDTGATFTKEKPLVVFNAKPHAEYETLVMRPEEVNALIEPRATILDDVQFTDHSYDVDGFIIPEFTEWDFGDGSTSDDPQPVHRFQGPGDYNVCLRVADDDVEFDTECRTFRVWGPKVLGSVEGAERMSDAVEEASGLEGRANSMVQQANATAQAAIADAIADAEDVPGAVDAAIADATALVSAAVDNVALMAGGAADEAGALAEATRACLEDAAAEAQDLRLAPATECANALLVDLAERADAVVAALSEVSE